MADIARIRNFQRIRRFRSDEMKRVGADVDVGDGLLNLRHVARNTFTARSARFVMGVRLRRRRVRTIRRAGPVTIQTQNVRRLP